ncbi:hypothetical protein D3C74_462160 [compost metagenome]
MLRPDHYTVIFHFVGSRPTDFTAARNHPRNDTDTVREDDQTFRAHFPQGFGEFQLIQIMGECHGDDIRSMGMQHNAV